MAEEQLQDERIRRIAKETFQSCLTKLGIDHQTPRETQKDMSTLRDWRLVYTSKEYTADMLYLAKWRAGVSAITSRMTIIIVGLIVVGAVTFFWSGFKDSFTSDETPTQYQLNPSQYKPPHYKQQYNLTAEEKTLREDAAYKPTYGPSPIKIKMLYG